MRSLWEKKEKIVFTNGCFDVLHKGHIELLRFCKTLGRVVVGLNDDQSVKSLKGPLRPINKVGDRKLLLESLVYVDRVIVFDTPSPLQLIREISPDFIVKGGDYSAQDVIGREYAKVIIFPTLNGYSSTKLIRDSKE